MNEIEFQPWPKIARLNREIVITEKIDGTNAAIGITPDGRVYAQSRNRVITPADDNYGFARWVEQHQDALREFLGEGLHFGEWWGVGIGRKYDMSERRFSLFNTSRWAEHTLGLLALSNLQSRGVQVHTVPVLYRGAWTGVFGYQDAATGEWLKLDADQKWPEVEGQENPRPRYAPTFIMEWLARVGSQAAPGFMKPEGICIFHKASGMIFKATLEKDEQPKGQTT